ncbi:MULTISPECIES: hypothetical protein [Pseudomonas]|uniref:TIGR02391 family protein n=2 Tax=Pseudomonas tolaasii TaxID=29442 RepID=A0A7Y8AMJ2_PSETO|nr:hypothetical protein [Pseudomonas tolaasii]ARB26474.1 hypothetical protein B5P22_03980 [Pseudomonas tolaasii]KAB0465138.1 hypothetical protein F7R12_30385 [Pseudomonas tolaasii]MBY8944190.1 hypothetical protein [Pseudomonas tolaasii]NWC20793.1 hypothetical protein [Pseudomonas tolaasii]NWC43369.1 hypothetical protein [Pseudomonas tolaasii]
MSEQLHFTRQTLLAASDFIEKAGTNAGFDLMVQRLDLDQWVPSGSELSVPKKRVVFNQTLLARAELVFWAREGQMTHGEALVREAVRLMSSPPVLADQEPFERCLARDGFTVTWDAGDCGRGTPPWLRRSLPQNVDLPAGDDLVHLHLKHFGFARSCGHLDQAIDAHTRGDWASANAQIRTFMESLILEIATQIASAELPPNPSLNNGFQALTKCEFLSENRAEWNQDGKGMLNGLMKMLHSDGSHKGLSDEDHSTMRLHIALVTARAILNRLANGE